MLPRPGSRSSPASVRSSATSVRQETALRRGAALSFAPPQLAPERAALAERAGHDRRIAPARLTGDPRPVVDAHLGDLPPVAHAPCEQLRRDHRPVGRQLDPADRAGADELERAVDVHHAEPERPPGEPAPGTAGGAAGEPVLAVDAVA